MLIFGLNFCDKITFENPPSNYFLKSASLSSIGTSDLDVKKM